MRALGRDGSVTGVSVSRLMALKPEAWAMATVTHPAVAEIHGIESWRGRPFLVVEFLPGGTLADKLRRGPLPAPRALSVTTLLADALAALHEAGYLHGDVKPSNIGFTSNGSPKLLDFGLARETNDADTQGGTLRYLSPEVLSGLPAEEADDVWSLCTASRSRVCDGGAAGRQSGAGSLRGDGWGVSGVRVGDGRRSGGGCITLGGGSWRDPGYPQTDRHPVTCVSWDDAQAYASWLSRTTGVTYRLPTEAEWDRAAAESQAGCYQDRTGNGGTCPVGSYGSNAAGLSDMVGNLWEWTEDCWEGDCGRRVLRGGSWITLAALLRPGARRWRRAGDRRGDFGFRVSRTLD